MIRLLLAESYQPGMDPTGWWMSEKLDGVRCYWEHETRIFRSREGNVYRAPKFYTARLPSVPLDGELWLGRGRFDEASGIARSGQDKGWGTLQFIVFDIPMREAGPFEQRQAMLKKLAEPGLGSQVSIMPQARCEDREMLERAMTLVVESGGEGLMLRQPGSLYVNGRSTTMLKYKHFQDAEAVVVGYKPGENSNVGVMGALWCVLPNGIKFKVGTGFSDAERRNPPPIGCTITFRFQGYTKSGKPRGPASFIRIRPPE